MFEYLIRLIERIAASFLAVVAALTFVSVILRYIFAWGLPDAYDVTENLLGVMIFWGIALAAHRNDHITVDLLWTPLPPIGRRIVDVFATVFCVVCLCFFSWAMLGKVESTRLSGVTTIDLHLPIWPYYLVAWLGTAAAVLLSVLRLLKLFRMPVGASIKAHSPGGTLSGE